MTIALLRIRKRPGRTPARCMHESTLTSSAGRWQKGKHMKKHRFPRKSPIPASQRLLAWLIMIVTLMLVLALLNSAEACGIHTPVGTLPESEHGLPWGTVNAFDVNFREGPGLEYAVVETWSLGAAVEVVSIEDGWAQVLRWTQPEPMWVWAEYLDIVE